MPLYAVPYIINYENRIFYLLGFGSIAALNPNFYVCQSIIDPVHRTSLRKWRPCTLPAGASSSAPPQQTSPMKIENQALFRLGLRIST